MKEALLWCRAFCQYQSQGFDQVKGKLNQTIFHTILEHHTIPSRTQLVGQGFLLIQDNDPKHTNRFCQRHIKSKEKQHVLQLMSWQAQSADLNPIELVWDKLNQKVRAKQPTSVDLAGKLGRTIFSLPPVFGGKNVKNLWSSDWGQRKTCWGIKRLRTFFLGGG